MVGLKSLFGLSIGMRNLKTALSIFLCLLLYQFIAGSAVLACIAALIAMQSTLGESVQQGRNRILGVSIGGVFGAAVASLGVSPEKGISHTLLISVGVTLLISACNRWGKQGAIVMGCVTYLTIVLSNDPQENIWLYSLWRVVDNTIGILIAVGINQTIQPPKNNSPAAVQKPSQSEKSTKESQSKTI